MLLLGTVLVGRDHCLLRWRMHPEIVRVGVLALVGKGASAACGRITCVVVNQRITMQERVPLLASALMLLGALVSQATLHLGWPCDHLGHRCSVSLLNKSLHEIPVPSPLLSCSFSPVGVPLSSLPFLVCWGVGFVCCLQSPIRSRGRLPVGLGSSNKIPVPSLSLSRE